jgi:hypothetical protein
LSVPGEIQRRMWLPTIITCEVLQASI